MFADESAFYLLPAVVRTWAKKGQTPMLACPTSREHLSVAGAVTLDGRVLTKVQKESFTGAGVVSFLKHLLGQISGKIVLVWDGASIHRCKEVKAFLAAGGAKRLRLVPLPPYAPELNPTEGVWGWLKRALGNVCCKDADELRYELGLAIAKLRRRPHIVQAFFQHAGLQT